MICGRCNSDTPGRIVIKFDKVLNKCFEYCTQCADISIASTSGFTDAQGNKIALDSKIVGKYSYAIGGPITSKRQFSEVLKRDNLVQSGTAYNKTGGKHGKSS